MSISDWMNPVTLKELRQLVRSRLVAAALIGFLAVAIITVSVVLLTSSVALNHGISLGTQGLGTSVFGSIYFILTGLLLLVTPLFVGFRMGAERSNEHLDLQYTTALTPRQLIDGKVAASLILILLFATASLPFISLSYLLRGLDVIQALLATLMLICVAIACVYEALFLAVVSTSRVFRVLLVLVLFSFQMMIVGSTFGFGLAMVSSNSISIATWADAAKPGLFLAGWLSICLLLRAMTMSLVMPKTANRALTVRGWGTGIWLCWGLIAGFASWRSGSIDACMAWCFLSVVFLSLVGAVSASFKPGYSRRVLAAVSQRRWRRLIQFIFFSGAENGMLWALLIGSITITVGIQVEAFDSMMAAGAAAENPSAFEIAIFFLNLNAYLWMIRAAWRFGLQRWIRYRFVGVVTAAMITLGGALPRLAALGQAAESERAWYVGDVFAIFSEGLPDTDSFAITVAIWIALALLANMPGIFRAFRDFKPCVPLAQHACHAVDQRSRLIPEPDVAETSEPTGTLSDTKIHDGR